MNPTQTDEVHLTHKNYKYISIIKEWFATVGIFPVHRKLVDSK